MKHMCHYCPMLGLLLTAVLAVAPLTSHAERNLEAEIATSSAAFAQSNAAPSDACAALTEASPRGQVQCNRQFAINQLQSIALLGKQSRLFTPLLNTEAPSGLIFELNSEAENRDYLAQQLARVQVLAGYAMPYVRYLQTSQAGVETAAESVESAYWQNTINALKTHAQFKATDGPVFQIEQLFLERINGLTWANCKTRFDNDAKEPEFGNDLFSRYRSMLVTTIKTSCKHRDLVEANAALEAFFRRFNAELAGKYPFTDDPKNGVANVDTTRLVLIDYLDKRDALLKYSRMDGNRYQDSTDRFFDGLDAFVRYWGPALGLKAEPKGLPIRVQFRVLPNDAVHDDQFAQWEISTGAQNISHRETGQQTLHWIPGHGVAVRFVLSSRSPWTVVPDPAQHGFIADGKSAAFVDTSPWALINLIKQHQPTELPATLPGMPEHYWLEFKIPLKDSNQRQTTARVYVAIMPDMPFPKVDTLNAPVR